MADTITLRVLELAKQPRDVVRIAAALGLHLRNVTADMLTTEEAAQQAQIILMGLLEQSLLHPLENGFVVTSPLGMLLLCDDQDVPVDNMEC